MRAEMANQPRGQCSIRSPNPASQTWRRGAFEFAGKWRVHVRAQPETGMGYIVASMTLRDGRRFDQVLLTDTGRVDRVRGLPDIPFIEDEIVGLSRSPSHTAMPCQRATTLVDRASLSPSTLGSSVPSRRGWPKDWRGLRLKFRRYRNQPGRTRPALTSAGCRSLCAGAAARDIRLEKLDGAPTWRGRRSSAGGSRRRCLVYGTAIRANSARNKSLFGDRLARAGFEILLQAAGESFRLNGNVRF